MTDVLAQQRLRLDAADGERWWGGAVADGQLMPFGAHHRRDLGSSAGIAGEGNERFGNNQSAPLLLSSRGRFVWSEAPFDYEIIRRCRRCRRRRDLCTADPATASAMPSGPRPRRSSRPPGRRPRLQMLRTPQYNTWIEMPYRPTQDGVLAYAQGLLDAGFPPGVLMIDDRWSPDYGTWDLRPVRVPRPDRDGRSACTSSVSP